MLSGNWPWIIGLLGAIAYFIFFEYRALRHPERNNTLSHWVYMIGAHFPLSIGIMGIFIGVLMAHFWWHWCPAGSVVGG